MNCLMNSLSVQPLVIRANSQGSEVTIRMGTSPSPTTGKAYLDLVQIGLAFAYATGLAPEDVDSKRQSGFSSAKRLTDFLSAEASVGRFVFVPPKTRGPAISRYGDQARRRREQETCER